MTACSGEKPKTLNLFCWSEYVPQSVIEAFEKESGIKVAVENYASNEEMLAKLLARPGTYDLIQPSEYMVEALKNDGLLEKLDKTKIPNLVNLEPAFTGLSYDPANDYSVPWMAGSVGIVVNKEKITTPVTSYADVFTEANSGRIVVLDDARESVSWALKSLGKSVNDITPENLAAVKPVLSGWFKKVRIFDSDSPKTALLNGDVDLGIVWNGEGALLLQESDKFEWVIPSEGAHLFVDSLAIPAGAKNKAEAEAFMNFILRPEISAMISNEFPYTNPNKAGRTKLTPEQLANRASFPTPEELSKMEIFVDIGEKASAVDALVTDVRAE